MSAVDWAIILAMLEALGMAHADARMRQHRKPGVSAEDLPPAPLAWSRPALFTSVGNRYRLLAQLLLVAMVLTVLVAAALRPQG
jgi:hypothetical protein